MDPRDDEIEFDFFEDEPATREAPPSRVRLPRRGGVPRRRRPAGPPRGATPLLRLLALVAIVVAVLVFFGLVIQSCAATSKHDSYAGYMSKVAVIAHSSQDDGVAAANALIAGGKVADIDQKLTSIAQQERQNVSAAQSLSPPGRLRPENQQLVEALQLRVNGVQGLASTFAANPKSNGANEAATLAAAADRLLASDVVWDDLFRQPSTSQMKSDGVTGVVAPESHFVANPDFATQRSMSLLLTRLRGTVTPHGGTATGLHGTNLVSVKALPSGPTLSESATLNTVVASANLGFGVVVHDGGNFQEVNVKVTLTIQRSPPSGNAIVQTKTIQVINPGEDVTVTFQPVDVGSLIAQKATLRVDVAPVPNEKTLTNNSASYPVIFSLAP